LIGAPGETISGEENKRFVIIFLSAVDAKQAELQSTIVSLLL